ncbi:MAG TPA: GWxTD domain-containing protein [Gemmatimonadales bacterium]|nr:GWxTD domain-containing protein [Gemmatimonadales bacterium]
MTLLPFLLLSLQDPLVARAESLLARHELAGARKAAETLVQRYPDDASVHLLLGRVWLEWPVYGRYRALEEFRAAERLTPDDPAPWYWQTRVGLRLGDDEGEVMVREAVLRILAIDPEYRDAWDLFSVVYHDEGIWRRADQALALHPNDPLAVEHRAGIAIARDDFALADSLAGAVLGRRRPYVPAYLLRAEADFGEGWDSAGYVWYDSAVAHADIDSTGAMWDEVWMIASPEEAARHDSTPPGERQRFFSWFWDKRDPNLVTPVNERIAEHFRRLVYVRRVFHILHPYSYYHRSATWRTIIDNDQRDSLMRLIQAVPGLAPPGSMDSVFLATGMGPARESVGDTVGSETIYLKTQLDARGILWIRHGPPDIWAGGMLDPRQSRIGSPLEFSSWEYDTPDGILTIGLRDFRGGGVVLYPVSSRQFESARSLLATDNTSIPAPLVAGGWTAFFKAGDFGLTDVYFRAAPETAAVAIWGKDGDRVARAAGPGLMQLTVPPGGYTQGFDVDSAGVLGRSRAPITIPAYSQVQLGLSSLLLTPGDSVPGREAMLAGMPADLTYSGVRALAAYTEVYGLARDRSGLSQYTARYTFAPERGLAARALGKDKPVVFEFTRSVAANVVTPERLVIAPGLLAPGRYRVTLAVTDILRNVKSQTVALSVTVR